jgi:hypothetical protein
MFTASWRVGANGHEDGSACVLTSSYDARGTNMRTNDGKATVPRYVRWTERCSMRAASVLHALFTEVALRACIGQAVRKGVDVGEWRPRRGVSTVERRRIGEEKVKGVG